MGSILIRQVPDDVHKDFKKLCQAKNTSMENEMIRLIAREVKAAARRKEKAPRAAAVSPTA
jgi:plasmid stability protein